ncbi:MAG TPA: multiheme c-type cytochrome [Candidatus Polarisedimenticolia bacterium]|nr:multiheme c-type cytochrome [Candidatus Polarisedimenticolia bacterium]
MHPSPGGANGRATPASGIAARESEWRRRLAAFVLAWLAFETLSGLSIYLLAFSAFNQWMVVVHTAGGLLVLIPALWYQVRHLAVYWSRPLTAIKLMGYLASVATLVAVVSGLVLTWQALLMTRISYGWDLAHVVSTFALIAFAAPHVGLILLRDLGLRLKAEAAGLLAAQRRALASASAITVGFFAVVGLAWVAYPGDRLVNEFPADYSHKYGEDRPFAPSLARTETGGAYDARSLSGSESCGTSGCHEQIAEEWSVSAHRWAAMDLGFQRIQTEMAKQNGPESTRYCGGCHDPISLFSGTKNIFAENLTALAGYNEGVSCLSCHSVRKTDVEGNANYIVAQPTRYLFEMRDGEAARWARDFLIRSYPRRHVEDLSKRVFKTPEYCAACHKQFIDQEVNNVGWVQLQNQYDNWRKSRWNHPDDPKKTIECRECHMPLVASRDPAAGDALDYNRAGDDGMHRSHRFVGANQVMPALLKLPGADRQIELTEQWLRGEFPIPEIEHKWTRGPAVAVDLIAPESSRPGESITIKAVVTSNKVGHDFPTGPLDIIQSWIELSVLDESDRVVYLSGARDDRHFIQPGAFMFKAEPVDQYGNLIDRHNLWEMVGVRYRRSLFPGFSDTAQFAFRCPGTAESDEQPTAMDRDFTFEAPAGEPGVLKVRARLLYRKIDQYLLNFMFGEEAGLTTPVTEMARSEATIRLDDSKFAWLAQDPAP